MGYRLYAAPASGDTCLGKLFGYADEEDLESYQWLLDRGYISEDAVFGYGDEHPTRLTAEEFAEFVELYDADYKKYYGEDATIKDTVEVVQLLEETAATGYDVRLEWW